MPLIPTKPWPLDKRSLCSLGEERVKLFCKANNLLIPTITIVPSREWHVSACAYYRPDTEAMRKWTKPGINICLEKCATICNNAPSRNWNWPGNTTDREPYGVLCHELGHHVDWLTGEKKWSYGSEYCEQVMRESGEPPITSYAPNPAEWFAEVFRLFVANPMLLQTLRPRAFTTITRKFDPVGQLDWRKVLGNNAPSRIIKALENKGAK